jgi:hypothetical protein
LICHNHNPSVAQVVSAGVLLVVLQPHDLLDVLNFLILHYLIMVGFANVEEFTAKGEDAEVITPDDRETRYCQCLGGVTFCENEGAILAVARTGVVRVTELGHTVQASLLSVGPTMRSHNDQPRALATVQRFQLFIGFESGPVENIVDDCRLAD